MPTVSVSPLLPTVTPPTRGATQPPPPVLDRVNLLHINDVHEAYTAWPMLVSAFNTLRPALTAQGQTVLSFAAGDMNIDSDLHDWPLTIALMNQAHLDAATPGNHDFDAGDAPLAAAALHSTFPWLGANVQAGAASPLGLAAQQGKWLVGSTVVERDGHRYGLIGVTTPAMPKLINDDANLHGTTVANMSETAKRIQTQVDALEARGVNRIILISHLGYKSDRKLVDPLLGYGLHGVDVIVGGHSHTELNTLAPGQSWLTDSQQHPVMVVQTGKNGHNMGWAQVDFDEAGVAHPVAVNLLHSGQFMPDATALGLINHQLGASATVASLAQPYDNTHANTAPDPMAQTVADTLLMSTGADLALVPSAEVKDGAEAGALTQRHLREMFPYASQHVVASVKGEQLLGAFKAMAEALAKDEGHPSLLHTSHNLRMVINQETGELEQVLYHPPKQHGSGDWQPLNPNATYTVASDAFTFNGQDYPSLKEAKVERTLALPMRDLMAVEFYTESKRNHGQPLPLPVDNRLQLNA